jgi:DNA-binding NtrC family response regulator
MTGARGGRWWANCFRVPDEESVSLNIFAIEDDRDALANLHDILGPDGHRVTGAGTLQEATAGRDWSEFSIILMDRKLPDGSADALLPHLQAAAPHAAVIVITGHADLEGTMAAVRHGAADYLLKPINPDLLRAAVARVAKMQALEQRALQAERLAAIGQAMAVLSHESGNALARTRAVLEMLALEVQDRPEALDLIEGFAPASTRPRRRRAYPAPPWTRGRAAAWPA